MNKSTIYIVIILLLVICNGIFGFMLFSKPGPPPGAPPMHQQPKEVIIEKLHFSDDQIEEYDKLIDWHRSEITAKEEKLRILKDQLYSLLIGNSTSEEVAKISQEIGEVHAEIEQIHFKHFNDIHGICTSDQEADFNAMVKELGKIFAPPPPPPPHGPKK